mgnify:CR=1 FL=1
MKPIQKVQAILYDMKDNEPYVLILHRVLHWRGWEFLKGTIDKGESAQETIEREIKEETGMDLKSNPTLIAAQDILRVEGLHVVRLTYTATIDGEVHVDGEEHTGYKWLPISELKQIENLDIYLKELLDQGLLDN